MLFTEDDGAEGEESEARSAGEDETLAEPEASRRPNLRVIK